MTNPLLADPTRTGFIRQAFIKEIAKRFSLLKQEVDKLIVTDDAFGLVPNKSSILSYSTNDLVENYPGQPRDSHGRFGRGGLGTEHLHALDKIDEGIRSVYGLGKRHGVSIDTIQKLAASRHIVRAGTLDKDTGITGKSAEIYDITAKGRKAIGLAPKPEDTPEFKKWFSGSKVVDEQGKPLVVYHGSYNPGFTEFKIQDTETGKGVFFTSNKFLAEDYAKGELTDLSENPRGKIHDSAGIYHTYLSIKNPAIHEAGGESWLNLPTTSWINSAARNGHDGVIIKDIKDAKHIKDMPGDLYVVFHPEQIKSATANKGTFDPSDPIITHQEIACFSSGKSLIYARDSNTVVNLDRPSSYLERRIEPSLSGVTTSNAYNPLEKRDEHGRWIGEGGTDKTPTKKSEYRGWITPHGLHIPINNDERDHVWHQEALHAETQHKTAGYSEAIEKLGYSRIENKGGKTLYIETSHKSLSVAKSWVNENVDPKIFDRVQYDIVKENKSIHSQVQDLANNSLVSNYPGQPRDELGRGESNERLALQSADKTADLFGLPRARVKFTRDESGKSYGEHGDSINLVNVHLGSPINKQLNFKTTRTVTDGEHLAAHETAHRLYSEDSELGAKSMAKLKEVKAEFGNGVSMYGAFGGAHENLMELGAAYSHSPEALKSYSSEMYQIAHEWVNSYRKSKGLPSVTGNKSFDRQVNLLLLRNQQRASGDSGLRSRYGEGLEYLDLLEIRETSQERETSYNVRRLDDSQADLSSPVANTRFSFHTDEQKLQAFRQWLGTQVKKYVATGDEDKWWDKYIADAYKKGQGRAFDEVDKKRPKDLGKPLDFYNESREQFLRSSFGQPETKEKIKLLAARTFNELQGVTDYMSQVLTRTLMDGVAQGKNPKDIAKDINKNIDSIGLARANTIARTEVARAHNESTLDSLEALGVDSLNVMVEWRTTYPHLVTPKAKKSIRGRRNKAGKPYMVPCKICAPLNGVVLTIAQARGMFPRHCNCLCCPVPANLGESTEGQKRTPAKIRKAIDLSLRREAPEGVSLAEQRKESSWVGGDLEISKGNYPNPLFNEYVDEGQVSEIATNYPGQPRDSHGRFGTGGKGVDSPEFKKWFGNSKVVDSEGKPLVVYHGTEHAGFGEFHLGSFFTEHRGEAGAYADLTDTDSRKFITYQHVDHLPKDIKLPKSFDIFESSSTYEDEVPQRKVWVNGNTDRLYYHTGKTNPVGDPDVVILSGVKLGKAPLTGPKPGVLSVHYPVVKEHTVDDEGTSYKEVHSAVYPVYLSIQNPINLSWSKSNILGKRLGATDESIKQEVEKYQKQGYDGIETISDDALHHAGKIVKQFIPFSSQQVKSAIGNRGTFDPTSSIITHELVDNYPGQPRDSRGRFGSGNLSRVYAKLKNIVEKGSNTATLAPTPAKLESKQSYPSLAHHTEDRKAPSGITFSGTPTPFTHAVWDKIEDIRRGYLAKDHKALRELGELIHKEIHSHPAYVEASNKVDTLSKAKDVAFDNLDKAKDKSDYDRLDKIYQSTKERFTKHIQGIESQQLEEKITLQVMKKIRDFGTNETIVHSGDKTVAKLAQDAAQKLPTDWMTKVATIKIQATSNAGDAAGSFSPFGKQPVLAMSLKGAKESDIRATAVHELGHATEHVIPTLGIIEREYLESRMRPGEKPEKSEATLGGEKVEIMKDKFPRAYSGRLYNGVQADGTPNYWPHFEIISTGVEAVLGGHRRSIDDDHAKFIYGVLAMTTPY